MENQIDISNSYFINKSNIKIKNTRRHEKIKAYEEVKIIIIREQGQIKETLEINRIKDKIDRTTSIYFY